MNNDRLTTLALLAISLFMVAGGCNGFGPNRNQSNLFRIVDVDPNLFEKFIVVVAVDASDSSYFIASDRHVNNVVVFGDTSRCDSIRVGDWYALTLIPIRSTNELQTGLIGNGVPHPQGNFGIHYDCIMDGFTQAPFSSRDDYCNEVQRNSPRLLWKSDTLRGRWYRAIGMRGMFAREQ